jgi:signal transduction histidine kinase
MSSIDRFRQLRSELIAELMRIETQRMVNENMIPALKLQLRQTIAKNLADLTQDLRESMASQQGTTANWQDIAIDLRESAAGSVRSISHNLWGQKQLKTFPDLTPFEIARVLVSTFIQRKEVLAELESKIEASKIQALSTEQLTLRFSKDLAKYLHGNLQSRLMATAFAIETAGAISDDVELAAQLEVARQAMATPFDHFFETVPKSLTAEITKLSSSWDTLLLTSFVISGNDEQFSINESRAILLCIEEGLANALHHGHASEVAINIATTLGMHDISLVDNGIGPTLGLPGLGTSLFNSCAGSNWSLSRGPEGIGAKLNLQITQ